MSIREYYKNRKNQMITAVFLITVFIACSPLISRYCINGHDLEYHLLRIESLKEGIRMGKPFLKVNTLFFGNAGYASSMFYPDFLLYIPALLRVLGVSINASYHIFVALSIILCYLSVYFCVKGMTDSAYGGMIAAVTLTLAQYHLDDIYVRGAVGEYTAFIFIPIAVYGIYNAVFEEMDKPQLFVAGYAGLILCHTTTFLMCTVFGVLILLLRSKKTILNGKVLVRLLISTAAVLLLTAYYWIPMLEQFSRARFYISTPWVMPDDAAVTFLSIFGSGFPAMGCVCVLVLIPRIFIRKKAKQAESEADTGRVRETEIIEYADLLIAAGAVFTVLASDIIPWGRIGRYLSMIQFPWRFFIMGTSLFSVAAGLIFSRVAGDDEDVAKLWVFDKEADSTTVSAGAVILCILLIINGISGFGILNGNSQGYYDYSDDYYSYKPFTAGVIAGEWLPQTVTDRSTLIDDSERMIADDGSEVDFVRIKNSIEADLKSSYGYVDVPFIYYYGYTARITDANGKTESLEVTGEGRNGMCRVYTKDHGKGVLKVTYSLTPLSVFSVILSLLTAAAAVSVYIFRKKKNKKVLKKA
ncbi:MAG: hypothetical protein K6F34_00350 [Lachnospiraceae bacterium]|nr:hypothetical protein [Lachnospiraceae bacterium]